MQNDRSAVSPHTNTAYRYANTFPQHLHKLCVVCGNVLFFPTCALFIYFSALEQHRALDPQPPAERASAGGWVGEAHLRGRKQPSQHRPASTWPSSLTRLLGPAVAAALFPRTVL